ncbi:alcohol dehydrogenase catalytic domain-containing protein [Pigmentiphaga sp. CHJ604]|uniref:alcohol dehydrogenase catalytic domain-containing protein n=1 Tax=Pigmentiphaga sp. CHJ604 TaxID=3081984 RepID=UPI0030D09CF6
MLSIAKTQPGPNGLAVRQVAEPVAGAGEILLRVQAAGICGTDMHIYHDHGPFAARMALPRILGHEVCGIVEALGPAVSGIEPGDLVTLESHIPCWRCMACRTGRAHVCAHTRHPGIDLDGAFAEYMVAPAAIAWVNPAGVPVDEAALLEPLGIAVHATLEGSAVAGQSVVVNGCGPIGLMNIAVARHFGARMVIGVDPNPLRRTLALQMGADAAIDPRTGDLPRQVRDMVGPDGADVVVEYSATADGAHNTFAMLAPLGQVRWVGTPSQPVSFDFGLWRKARPTIFNISGRRIWQTWEKAAPLVYERRIDLRPLISHVLPLAEGIRGFELIHQGQANKILMRTH